MIMSDNTENDSAEENEQARSEEGGEAAEQANDEVQESEAEPPKAEEELPKEPEETKEQKQKQIEEEQQQRKVEEEKQRKAEEEKLQAQEAKKQPLKEPEEEQPPNEPEEDEKQKRLEVEKRKKEEAEARILAQEAEERKKRRQVKASQKDKPASIVFQEESKEGIPPEIICIIKTKFFEQSDLTCNTMLRSDINPTFKEEEELISKPIRVLNVYSEDESHSLSIEPYNLILPCYGRMPPSREPVMKMQICNYWEEFDATEVNIEGYKDMRFVQAKMEGFGIAIVTTRFKRDTFNIKSEQPQKVVSTYDARVTMNIEKDCFDEDSNDIMMIVQPLESANVADFRQHDSRGKRLLSTSPLLHVDWNCDHFKHSVTIALPCPPNPNKAKKLGLGRKTNNATEPTVDENRKVSVRPVSMMTKAQTPPAATSEEQKGTSPIRWYMGQYALDENDESEEVWLLTYSHGRWMASHTQVNEPRSDLVTFSLDSPAEKVVVVRTQVDTEDDNLRQIGAGLMDQLCRRQVHVLLKQGQDDPYDAIFQMTPSWNADKVSKALMEKGYKDGPLKPEVVFVCEGDSLTLELQGNLKFEADMEGIRDKPYESLLDVINTNAAIHEKAGHKGQETNLENAFTKTETQLHMIYQNNLPTFVKFYLNEKDRYLQRNLDNFRGMMQVLRKVKVVPVKMPPVRRLSVKDYPPQTKPEMTTLLCSFYIDIPKDHLEIEPVPKRIPFKVPPDGMLNDKHLTFLAEELGDEWKDLAEKLQLSLNQVETIIRWAKASDDKDFYAKYEMLVTWFKGCPLSADMNNILANALQAVGRRDLTGIIRFRWWSGHELQ